MARRKLGRGLDALIGRGRSEPGARADRPPEGNGGGADRDRGPSPSSSIQVRELRPGDIVVNPRQPRKRFAEDELRSLQQSISREGLLQPLLVRKAGRTYQLVAGERRLRAAQALGLEAVPALVVDVPEKRLLELALIENIHRADLNPIEVAEGYRHLVEENGWTQEKLASELGVSRSSAANTLRLLELPGDMQEALIRGHVSPGHAKVLLSLSDDDERRRLFERIAEENLSVRELEGVRDLEGDGDEKAARRRKRRRGGGGRKKPYVISLEEELSEQLGTRVRITERKGGRGVLAIEFYSKEDFERLRVLLTG